MKFLNNVEVLTPTDNAHAATKKYVDDNTGTGGIPSGGLAGQVLQKESDNDYDVGWITVVFFADYEEWDD